MLYKVVSKILKGFLHIVFRVRISGMENIPKDGGAIVAFNHRSYWDVPFAGSMVKRPLRFMAKSGLFKNPIFGGFIKKCGAFPVQRGKGDIGAIKSALKILNEGNLMLIYPEGKRVLNGERVKAKSGVALIAQKAKVPVIPICISGKYTLFNKIYFNVGEPIDFSEYYDEKLDAVKLQELSDDVLNSIYALEVKND